MGVKRDVPFLGNCSVLKLALLQVSDFQHYYTYIIILTSQEDLSTVKPYVSAAQDLASPLALRTDNSSRVPRAYRKQKRKDTLFKAELAICSMLLYLP